MFDYKRRGKYQGKIKKKKGKEQFLKTVFYFYCKNKENKETTDNKFGSLFLF